MVCRIALLHAAAMAALFSCSDSSADTPLVTAELDAERTIAEADWAYAVAVHRLATWRLSQLNHLRSDGHASWQEVAEQEVTVRAAAAAASASHQYLSVVRQWQARAAGPKPHPAINESECIQLYMPGSPRLVAWLPSEIASRELSQRHLEDLRGQYDSFRNIDLASYEAAIAESVRAVKAHDRAVKDTDLRRRAEIRLQLAEAEYQTAKARKESAGILARRIALLRQSLRQAGDGPPTHSVTRSGTRLVDASADSELARWVTAMAKDKTFTAEQIALLEHHSRAVSDRMDALQQLADYRRGDDAQRDRAKSHYMEIQQRLKQAQEVLRLQQQVSREYERTWKSPPGPNVERARSSFARDDAFVADASVVRHWLAVERLKSQSIAGSAAAEAQHDYLVERLRRVERIPERARRPKELDQLRHEVQTTRHQQKLAEHQFVLLQREQDRFGRQLDLQRGDSYQLVQLDDGTFMRREELEIGQALIATVGYVGRSPLFPRTSIPHPYLESTIMLDCLATLQKRTRVTEARTPSLWALRPTPLAPGLVAAPFYALGPVASGSGSGIQWSYHAGLRGPTGRPNPSGLRLATDGILYPQDRFCYLPYAVWPVHRDAGWATTGDLHPASQRGFPTWYAFDREATGLRRLDSFYWRSRCPSFPYRNSYQFQTAFPARSLLYSNPNVRPFSTYRGFRH